MRDFLLKYKLWFVSLIIVGVIQLLTISQINRLGSQIESIHAEDEAEKVNIEIKQSILDKQRATTAIALALSSEVSEIPISAKMGEDEHLQRLIKQITNYSDYKNIWIQIVDLDGNSMYRSWSPIKDNLANIRPEFDKVRQTGAPLQSISSGRFDITIKVVTPIYHRGELVGFLDLISHFNSIQRRLKNVGIDSMVIATEERSKLMEHAFSPRKIGQFYVSNLNPDQAFFQRLTESQIKSLIAQEKGYWYKDHELLVKYPLTASDQSVHGYFFALTNLSETIHKADIITDLRTKRNLFMIADIAVIVVFLMAVSLYYMRSQRQYYQDILNYEQEAVLVTNGRSLVDANQQLFSYFPKLKIRSKGCVCDAFEAEPGFIQKYMDGILWIDYLIMNPNAQHKVLIVIDGIKRVFQVRARRLGSDRNLSVVVLSDITKLEQLNTKLHQQSRTDELTQVGNRLSFNEILSREIGLAKRNNQPFSVVLFDIDLFKRINDQYGHQVGDEVLQKIAKVIQSQLRSSDFIFRIGGEEFVILLAMQDIHQAEQLAEKVRKVVDEADFSPVEKVTISLGVAQLRSDDHAETLMSRADKALYQAKQAGRNQVKVS